MRKYCIPQPRRVRRIEKSFAWIDHRLLRNGYRQVMTRQANHRLVHLVNYRSDGPVKNLAVTVRVPADETVKSVKLASPEHENDIDLPFNEQAGTVTFTVPTIDVYEIAAVSLTDSN